MKALTVKRMRERRDYILKKMGEKYTATWYERLIHAISDCGIDFYESIGYCGKGDSSCKKESLSSKLVPDFDCINWSCWFHDRLRELVKMGLITKKMSDEIMKYSGYYDAQKEKKGFKKVKAIVVSRLYYRGVQIQTFFSSLFGGKK